MKKLIFFITAILPLAAFSQEVNYPSTMLKTLDERNVRSSQLFENDRPVLLFFFNETSPDVIDNFDYLANLQTNKKFSQETKIIAIYSATSGTYANIPAFINGNDIDIETYIDVNGEFQRAMGISANSALLMCNSGEDLSARYSGPMACTGELISLVDSWSNEIKASELELQGTWARNSMENK